MSEYGDAEIVRAEDGRIEVVRADPVIGISLELLASAGDGLAVDDSGCLLLAGDSRYRYRPVRFAGVTAEASGPCRVLVCERVTA
jgi:hypothetical protein